MLSINIVVYIVIVVIVYKRYRSMLGLKKSLYPAATTRSTFARQTIFWYVDRKESHYEWTDWF